MPSAVPALTFPEGGCAEAIDLYKSLLPNVEVVEKMDSPEGLIFVAKVKIGDVLVYMADGNHGGTKHDWNFTPGVSLLVEVGSEEEVVRIHDAFVADGGSTRMEPSEIPPFGKLAFLADRFGMNWQLVARGI